MIFDSPVEFKDAARHASVVETANGPGVLIGGSVFSFEGPLPLSGLQFSLPSLYCEWLVEALRQGPDTSQSNVIPLRKKAGSLK